MPSTTGRPGWAPFLSPGVRVVLRFAIDPASAPAGEHRSDALGTITAADEHSITVMTRRGEARVLRGLVVAAKEVPPPPLRRPDGRAARGGDDAAP